jgi:antitoxin component of MazEF toxin-antitoxin module
MLEAKFIKIGNSHVIRIPKRIISKYGLGSSVLLAETADGILIYAAKSEKLSWEDTYKAMSEAEQDEWTDWQNMDAAEEVHL